MSNERIDWKLIAQESDKALLHAQERNAKLIAACKLVLLFYTAGTWEYEERAAWATGIATCFDLSEPPTEATTKNLCNAVRAALGITNERTSP